MNGIQKEHSIMDQFPSELKEIYQQYEGTMLDFLKETMITYYESNSIDKMCKYIFPVLP